MFMVDTVLKDCEHPRCCFHCVLYNELFPKRALQKEIHIDFARTKICSSLLVGLNGGLTSGVFISKWLWDNCANFFLIYVRRGCASHGTFAITIRGPFINCVTRKHGDGGVSRSVASITPGGEPCRAKCNTATQGRLKT